MDENRTDLKSALRELAADESGDIGPHAGSKRLIAYRQGKLPAAEREALQEHLSRCPRCAGLLLELRDFEAASAGGAAPGPESLRREAWEALSRRLPWRVSAVRPIAGAARREPPRPRAPRVLAGLAAVLLLAVVGLSAWAAVTIQRERQRLARAEQQLQEREKALAAARRALAEAERRLAAARRRPEGRAGRVQELEARVAELTSELEDLRKAAQAPKRTPAAVAAQEIAVSVAPRFSLRGQEAPEGGFLREGGAVNAIRLPARADGFTAALDLDAHPVYDEYRLELVDPNGQVLWTGRRPARSLLGDAGATVSIQGAGPGRYRLRIEGLRPDRTDFLAEYLLAVERQETPPQ